MIAILFSMSLYLGSEVFDVHTHPLQGDHHHLFIRQGTGLQGRSVFRTKLTFRPHSTDSFTHRKMTLSMADKTNKAQKVKVLPAVGKNPEALKQELIKVNFLITLLIIELIAFADKQKLI